MNKFLLHNAKIGSNFRNVKVNNIYYKKDVKRLNANNCIYYIHFRTVKLAMFFTCGLLKQ